MKNRIVWEGPSRLDGAPIVVIATGFERASDNEKTGKMIQVWIMRRDVSPLGSLLSGADKSVCGDCKHRGAKSGKRSCYVVVAQAPQQIYSAYVRGSYDRGLPAEINKPVRFGAWGDPAMVPVTVWKNMLKRCNQGWTGYTHQWKQVKNARYRHQFMASVDTYEEYRQAKKRGWRTFRVLSGKAWPRQGEIVCPADPESKPAKAGKKIQCKDCKLCAGTTRQAKDIAVYAHGSGAANIKRNI